MSDMLNGEDRIPFSPAVCKRDAPLIALSFPSELLTSKNLKPSLPREPDPVAPLTWRHKTEEAPGSFVSISRMLALGLSSQAAGGEGGACLAQAGSVLSLPSLSQLFHLCD